jgi:hypothetical protein
MSSKLFINNRVYVSGDVHPQMLPMHERDPINKRFQPADDEDYYMVPQKPPTDYWDGPCNLRYRVIDNVGPDWVTHSDLIKVSGRNNEWITDQVVDGKLEAAVRRGSKVPLFRVKEPRVLIKDAAPPPKPEERKQGKANNHKDWHKK